MSTPNKRLVAVQSFLTALHSLSHSTDRAEVESALRRCQGQLTVWLRLSPGGTTGQRLEVRPDGLWVDGVLAAPDMDGLCADLVRSGLLEIELSPRLDWPELLRLLFALGLRALCPPNHSDSITARLARSRLSSVALVEDSYAEIPIGSTPSAISRQANQQLAVLLTIAGELDNAVAPEHIRPLIQETWRHLLAHDHTQEIQDLIQTIQAHFEYLPEEQTALLEELAQACAARYTALEFPETLRAALSLQATAMRDPTPPPPPEPLPPLQIDPPAPSRAGPSPLGVAAASFAVSVLMALLLAFGVGVLPRGGSSVVASNQPDHHNVP